MSLYTQEEIDKYFGGRVTLSARAHMVDVWAGEWSERTLTVTSKESTNVRAWIKLNNLLYTDWCRQWGNPRQVNYMFRYEEDYLAATLALL